MLKKFLPLSLLLAVGVIVAASFWIPATHSLENDRISTTNADQSLHALDSQIRGYEKLIKAKPNSMEFKKNLMDLLQTKMLFLGNYGDLERMAQLVVGGSQKLDQILINIKFNMSTHQFHKVEKSLKLLSQMGYDQSKIRQLQISLQTARGEKLRQGLNEQREVVQSFPSYNNFLRLAAIQVEIGDFNSAKKNFEKALAHYKNTSPFAPALVYFQLGKMTGESQFNQELAKKYYQEALHYVPFYVKARVHLAEIELAAKRPKDALETLKPIEKSQDPEVVALKAEIYVVTGNEAQAKHFARLAKENYENLITKYPLAFGDHGAEFYMAVGKDPKKAFHLAIQNLENRKNKRAFDLVQSALNQWKEQKKKTL